VWKLLSCLCMAPSLTRGRVCHVPFSVCSRLSVFTSRIYVSWVLQFINLYTIYIYIYIYIYTHTHTHTSFFQSRLGTADYALLVTISSNYRSSLDTWTVVQLPAFKFKPFVVSVWGFAQYCVHFHFHDCEWFLLVFWIPLLCNRKRTEFGKPHAHRGPMWRRR
jgi:hypothetical protein